MGPTSLTAFLLIPPPLHLGEGGSGGAVAHTGRGSPGEGSPPGRGGSGGAEARLEQKLVMCAEINVPLRTCTLHYIMVFFIINTLRIFQFTYIFFFRN